jgi:hypothetical protein
MYTPVSVSSADDAASKFGPFGSGTLTRGIKESFDGQIGFSKTPDVWGMRVGGIKAKRASGDLDDALSNAVLKIEAINEGDMYNDVSVKFQEGNCIISNPKTGLSSSYSVDFDDWSNPDVQVHTLDELAANIAADSNLNGIISAIVYDYSVNFEVQLKATDAAVTSAEVGETKINIGLLENADVVDANLYLSADANGNTAWDGGAALTEEKNPIRAITSVYSINASDNIACLKGNSAIKVSEGSVAKGKAGEFNSILSNNLTANGVLDNGATSEGYWRVRGAQAVFLDNDLAAIGTEITAIEENDVIRLKLNVGAVCVNSGSTAADIGDGQQTWEAGAKNIKVTLVNKSDNNQHPFYFSGTTGAGGTAAGGSTGTGNIEVEYTGASGTTSGFVTLSTHENDLMLGSGPFEAYLDFDTELVELDGKDVLSAATKDTQYFVRGNEIVFGAAQPHELAFKYAQVTFYDEGTTLVVNDGQAGKLTLTGSCGPGYACGALAGADAIFGFSYTYYPGSPTAATVALKGGVDGINLTSSDLYNDLDEAYTHLNQDFFDIFTVMDARFDTSKSDYDSVTGVPVVMNAGFADQMRIFLNSFNGELIGVMGFEPLQGTGVGGRILASDVSKRVDYMTTPNIVGDPLRAANVLNGFHQPFMYAVEAEVIMNYRGNLYGTDAAAVTSGLLAAIPTEEAIYRFNLPGAQGLVWRYDSVDASSGKEQIDILSDSRLPVGIVSGTNIKLSESRSMGRAGSDFENIMTVLILQEVLQICRDVSRDYIGKVSSAQLLQAFQSQLDRTIGDNMVPRALRGFKAPVEMTPGERVVGKLTIPLTLSPQFELRDVHYIVQLTADEIAAAE